MIAVLLLALSLASCEAQPPGPGIEDIPAITGLDDLDAPVRERHDALRERLEQALDEGEPAAERAAAFGELGSWHHAHRFLDAAAACYTAAEGLAPGEARWPYLLAHVRTRQGEAEAARAAFERFLALRPDDLAGLVHLGELELEARRLEKAEALFERTLGASPGHPRVLAGLASVALEHRAYESAVRFLEEALERAPRSTRLRHALGLAYRGLGDLEKARPLLEAGSGGRTRQVPLPLADPLLDAVEAHREQGAQLHLQRAGKAFEAGRFPAAEEHLRRALAAAPDNAAARQTLGATLRRQGRETPARDAFLEMLELEPQHAAALAHLGDLAAIEGSFEDAEALYRRALEADPALARALHGLGELLLRTGRLPEAAACFESLLEAEPRLPDAYLGLAEAWVRQGRAAEARKALEMGLERLPDSPEIRELLARVLASAPDQAARDGARALELATALIEDDEANARRGLRQVETLAMALAENGRFEEAVRWQRAAVEAAARAPQLLAPARARLDLYLAGAPCRQVWLDGEHRVLVRPRPLRGER